MHRIIVSLSAMLVWSLLPVDCAESNTEHWLKVGDNVEIDIQMAKKSTDAKWRIGKICQINKKNNSYVIEMPDKSKKKIINSAKWVKAASSAVIQSLTEPAEIKSLEAEKESKKTESK